jgi:hypothetical protein
MYMTSIFGQNWNYWLFNAKGIGQFIALYLVSWKQTHRLRDRDFYRRNLLGNELGSICKEVRQAGWSRGSWMARHLWQRPLLAPLRALELRWSFRVLTNWGQGQVFVSLHGLVILVLLLEGTRQRAVPRKDHSCVLQQPPRPNPKHLSQEEGIFHIMINVSTLQKGNDWVSL